MQIEGRPSRSGTGHFLDQNRTVQKVAAHATVLLWYVAAEESQLSSLEPKLARHLAGLFPGGVIGDNVFFDKTPYGVAKGFVI